MSQPATREQLLESSALEPDVWDQQIAADFQAGRLDAVIGEALEDYRAGRVSKR